MTTETTYKFFEDFGITNDELSNEGHIVVKKDGNNKQCKTMRKLAGMTIKDMAEMHGYSEESYHLWETKSIAIFPEAIAATYYHTIMLQQRDESIEALKDLFNESLNLKDNEEAVDVLTNYSEVMHYVLDDETLDKLN